MTNASLAEIEAAAAARQLAVLGAFHPGAGDGAPEGCRTLVLLGPAEPGFWAVFTQSSEWRDGNADPVDRWSARVLGELAAALGGGALLPFGGPPYHPFYRWALASGRAWPSPVTLLVHEAAGLMVSYRGALALPWRVELPPSPPIPCARCVEKPCLAACPAGALTGKGYDVPACHAYLDTTAGQTCMNAGCAVRRACPVSQSYARVAEQSAYHMRQFHR